MSSETIASISGRACKSNEYYNYGDGNMAYLDYSSLNKEKEPIVIMAFYNGEKYEVVENVAEDLGAFIFHLVKEQLS